MSYNTIKLKNYSNVFEEYAAAAAITPGHLVEMTSAGKVQAHSTAGGSILPMVALEDDFQGKTISDAYALNNQVHLWIPGRGDQFYGILADGESVVIGDLLESNGDGTVKKHVADSESTSNISNQIVGVALAALDMSDSSGADPSSARLPIRVL